MEDDELEPTPRDLRAPLRLTTPPRRRFRLLTGAIAAVTLVLFAVAIWYAYVLGIHAGTGDQAPLVRSDQKPEKVRPDQPGGMAVPNQDKTVYDRVQPETNAKQPEQLLPPPEEPVARPKEQAPAEGAAPPESKSAEAKPSEPKAAEQKAPETKPAETKPAEQKPAQKPVEKKAAEQKATGAPTPVTPPAMKAPQTASAGGYRVQLGALRSEEEAAKAIAKLKSSNADLLGQVALTAQRADLGEKGTYYRVQSGPLGDQAAAKALCDSLRSRNVGCIVVRP